MTTDDKQKNFWPLQASLFGFKPLKASQRKITLVQSSSAHIRKYLSVFRIPIKATSRIERIKQDFQWSSIKEGRSKSHVLVKVWREIGLGKWFCRFLRGDDSLWHRIIKKVYDWSQWMGCQHYDLIAIPPSIQSSFPRLPWFLSVHSLFSWWQVQIFIFGKTCGREISHFNSSIPTSLWLWSSKILHLFHSRPIFIFSL